MGLMQWFNHRSTIFQELFNQTPKQLNAKTTDLPRRHHLGATGTGNRFNAAIGQDDASFNARTQQVNSMLVEHGQLRQCYLQFFTGKRFIHGVPPTIGDL